MLFRSGAQDLRLESSRRKGLPSKSVPLASGFRPRRITEQVLQTQTLHHALNLSLPPWAAPRSGDSLSIQAGSNSSEGCYPRGQQFLDGRNELKRVAIRLIAPRAKARRARCR